MTTPHRGFQCHAINNQINIQIKHNLVKNLNWPEANQLAINFTSVAEDLKLRFSVKQIQLAVRVGFELGSSGLTTRPRRLLLLYYIRAVGNADLLWLLVLYYS